MFNKEYCFFPLIFKVCKSANPDQKEIGSRSEGFD